MIRFILMLVTLLVSSSVFAAGGDTSTISHFHQEIFSGVTDKTDLSVHLLARIFGSVQGSLTGSAGSGAVMAVMFKYFNMAVVLVASITVGWSVLSAVMSGVQSGQFLGQQQGKNMLFTVIRVPLAIALLMPIGTGYSTYQSIVMKVVVEGTRLADVVWSHAVDEMTNGGQLYTPQTGDTTSDPVATFSGRKSDLSDLIKSAYQGLSCMYSKYYAAGPADENGVNSQYYVDYKANSVSFGGGCGSLSWSGRNSDLEGQMVRSVITDLSSPIQVDQCLAAGKGKGTCKIAAMTGQGSSDKQAAVTQAFVTAYNINRDFITKTTTSNAYSQDLKTAGLDSSTDKNPIGQGWIMAGSYFWDIVNLQNDSSKSGSYNLSIIPKGIKGDDILDSATITSAETAASNQVAGADPQGNSDDASLAEGRIASDVRTWSSMASGTMMEGGPVATLLSAPLLISMSTIPSKFGTGGDALKYHPIVVIQRVGEACLEVGKVSLFVTMALATALAVGFAVCSAESPLAEMFNIGVEWIKPIVQTIATGLIGVGAMLTFYVPLYPFFVYMFAAVGWFVAVLEAMVAAPLVCLGLTHPEGHDFLGKSEQALMLLLGVFLRPVLLVIGFLAAIAVSWAAFGLLNLGFAHIINTMSGNFLHSGQMLRMSSLTGNSAQQVMEAIANNYRHGMSSAVLDHDRQYLFTLPLLMIIYAIFVFNMLTVAFKPITMYVDILKWIGGPQSNDAAEQTAQKMQGSFQSAASGAGRLTGQAAGATAPYGTHQKGGRAIKSGAESLKDKITTVKTEGE